MKFYDVATASDDDGDDDGEDYDDDSDADDGSRGDGDDDDDSSYLARSHCSGSASNWKGTQTHEYRSGRGTSLVHHSWRILDEFGRGWPTKPERADYHGAYPEYLIVDVWLIA